MKCCNPVTKVWISPTRCKVYTQKSLTVLVDYFKMLLLIKRPSFLKFKSCAELVKSSQRAGFLLKYTNSSYIIDVSLILGFSTLKSILTAAY